MPYSETLVGVTEVRHTIEITNTVTELEIHHVPTINLAVASKLALDACVIDITGYLVTAVEPGLLATFCQSTGRPGSAGLQQTLETT
jgi:hypothetical protein